MPNDGCMILLDKLTVLMADCTGDVLIRYTDKAMSCKCGIQEHWSRQFADVCS